MVIAEPYGEGETPACTNLEFLELSLLVPYPQPECVCLPHLPLGSAPTRLQV